MLRYLGLRVLQAIGVLWAAFTISFVVLFLLPSDPVSIAVDSGGGSGTPVDAAAVAELQARYGLDKPVLEQYWTSLTSAIRGDFGTSISTGQPVTTAILDAVPSTLALAGLALMLAVGVGGGLAFLATYTRARWLRTALLSLPPLGVAVPTFWVGLLLLQVFSFGLPIFPAFGDRGFGSLVLPAITLAVPTGAVIAQVLATSLTTTWRQPFTTAAEAKGASRWRIQTRHVLRLASVPAFTIAGVLVGELLAGSVVVETVFSRAGVGRLTQTSVLAQDIPVVQGIVVLTSLVFVVVTLAVDIVYPLIDPRIVQRTTRPTKEPAHV
ncbi:ABC transporter permease [Rhodococcus sp. BP-241]|jgi:peptide/nickel transport system permease protein|uniref:ABC transporter permease n=1 Tax=unclassified Rhodococcus (in: high G+C Gram-positive bacteria) TaxID=192944 RepID=UPI0006FDA2A2|nr:MULTISPECIES: ABC transporter permease [unclassified Rhodococcus (in: high G+C Gram-positive bacteria)]KQU39462.1 peptide ABC transporter permease [Rhodococcus sp. Leaf225]KQU43898.1 peptide ABC transporter permease [Rhodococcus sp. Leaf258]MBY6706801.1 ABC transporter permease [Rhodococcus sp. BP-241]